MAAAGSASAWSVFIDGTGNAAGEAEALALDADGDVIAAGRLYDSVRFYDLVVLKRNGVTGGPIWQRASFGNGGAGCCGVDEGAHAVSVDSAGIVFAAGHLEFDPPPAGRAQDLAVIRFNPGGELWRGILDGGRSSLFSPIADLARAVALDPAGNPVAAGRLTIPVLTADGWASEFVVIKLASATGVPSWTRRIQGDAPLPLAAKHRGGDRGRREWRRVRGGVVGDRRRRSGTRARDRCAHVALASAGSGAPG